MEGAETELEGTELLHLKFHLLVPLLNCVILVVQVVHSNIVPCLTNAYVRTTLGGFERGACRGFAMAVLGNLPENSVSMATKSALSMLSLTKGSSCSKFSIVTSM